MKRFNLSPQTLAGLFWHILDICLVILGFSFLSVRQKANNIKRNSTFVCFFCSGMVLLKITQYDTKKKLENQYRIFRSKIEFCIWRLKDKWRQSLLYFYSFLFLLSSTWCFIRRFLWHLNYLYINIWTMRIFISLNSYILLKWLRSVSV